MTAIMSNIWIATVSRDDLPKALLINRELIDALKRADIPGCDAAQQALQCLAQDSASVSVSEELWHSWLTEVRRRQPDFRADCVLEPAQARHLIEASAANGGAGLTSQDSDSGLIMIPLRDDGTREDDDV